LLRGINHGAVGIGWRSEIASSLLLCPAQVDFVEVVAEACMADGAMRREVQAISALRSVVPHGVKLSLGSAEGVDDAHLARLAALCTELRAPCVSEHVSFVRSGETEIGHLTPLPRTREALAVLVRNVEHARRKLPDIPLLLENVACPFFWPDAEMTEAQFYQEVVAQTGCELILDLGNLYANARNEGLDPAALLAAFPLEHVAMVHVAGGITDAGFYLDTHAHPVPPAVFDLVAQLRSRNTRAALMIERDDNFDTFDMDRELTQLRQLSPSPSPSPSASPAPAPPPALAPQAAPGSCSQDLASLQHQIADLLTRPEPPSGTLAQSVGLDAILRSREILRQKRVDEALPLLSRVARVAGARAFAEEVVSHSPRARSRAAYADAFAIARAALASPVFANAAELDLLLLRARVHESSLAPRATPFAGYSNSASSLVFKSFGASSTVHLWSYNQHGRLLAAARSSGPR
jgi:uncharacterized protein